MSALRHVLLYGVAVLGFERYRVKGIVLGVALEEGLIRDAPVPLHTGARCVGVVPAVSTWDLYGINPGISFKRDRGPRGDQCVLALVRETPLESLA